MKGLREKVIVGMIDFTNKNKHQKSWVNWLNYKDLIYDAILEKRHIVIRCRKCGQLLAPIVQHTGPRNCGWRKEKSYWICHQCYYGWGGFDKPKEEIVKTRNKVTVQKIQQYKLTHPWVKFKEV